MTLVLGDSIVKDFPVHVAADVTCLSFSGYKIHELIPHAVRVAPFFTKIILHVGTNDIPSRQSVYMLVSDYRDLVTAIRRENPDVVLVISGVLPRFTNWWKEYDQVGFLRCMNAKADELNDGLYHLAKEMDLTFVDHWDDFQSPATMNRSGLHLSKEGCSLLLKRLHLDRSVHRQPLQPIPSTPLQPSFQPQPLTPLPCTPLTTFPPLPPPQVCIMDLPSITSVKSTRTSVHATRSYAAVASAPLSSTPPGQRKDNAAVASLKTSMQRMHATTHLVKSTSQDSPTPSAPKPPSTQAEWVAVHHRRRPLIEISKKQPLLPQHHVRNEEGSKMNQKRTKNNQKTSAAVGRNISIKAAECNSTLKKQPPLLQQQVTPHVRNKEGSKKNQKTSASVKISILKAAECNSTLKKEPPLLQRQVKPHGRYEERSMKNQEMSTSVGRKTINTPLEERNKRRFNSTCQKNVEQELTAGVKKTYRSKREQVAFMSPGCNRVHGQESLHVGVACINSINGGGPVANTYPRTCTACENIYQTRQSFSRHLKTCGQNSIANKTNCIFETCTLKFYHRTAMVKHLKDDHGYEIVVENLQFVDMHAFEKWKENEEVTKFSSFTKASNKTCNEIEHHYFTCQFDAANKSHRQSNEHYRLTSQKWSKGQIPLLYCPARMLVAVTPESVNVEYISSHNHPLTFENTKYHRMPASTRSFIKGSLAMGVSPEIVKNVLQSDAGLRGNRDGQVFPLKEHYVTSTYLNKVKTTMKGQGRIEDDATSVSACVHAMLMEEDNPIIVYKSQGMNTVIGNKGLDNLPHSPDLFALGIQTQAQFAMMEKGCEKVLCLDATHSTTHYDFYLINLIVPDEYGLGYPVAHFITNKQDSETLSLLLDSIKSRSCKKLNINVLMSDDDNSGWNAVQQVFGNDIKHLLCLWHVHRTWQRQTRAFIHDPTVQRTVYASVVTLMEERDIGTFKKMAVNFISTFKTICPEFVKYFESNYLNRPQVWAKSYRNFPHGNTDTNMYCESFHNKLKTKYLKRKQNKRVDVLLEVLLEMERDRFLEHDYKQKTNATTSQAPVSFLKRHEAGLKIPDSDVRQLNSSIWQVVSQDKRNSVESVMYSVEKIGDACSSDFCFQRCLELSCLGLCSHNYHCSCPDISGLCKHIHKVHSLGTRNVVYNTATSLNDEVCESESRGMFTTPDVIEENPNDNNNHSVTECLQYLDELKSFVNNPNIHRLMMRNLKTTLKDLVTQCRGVADSSFTQPLELTPTKPVNNNQNVQPQISNTPKLHRTTLKRKLSCSAFSRPTLEERKQVRTTLLHSDPINTPELSPLNNHPHRNPRKILHAVHPLNTPTKGDTTKSITHVSSPKFNECASVKSHNTLQFKTFHSTRTYERSKPFTPPIDNGTDLSKIVLQINPEINISLLHLKSLEPKVSVTDLEILMQADPSFHTGWLYDTIINGYMHKCCENSSNSTFCTTTASLSILNDMPNKRLWIADTLHTKDFIFVPCNLQSHWVLFVCRPQIQVIEFYDPLYMAYRPMFCTLLNNLKSLLNRKLNFPVSTEWKISCPPHAMQSDMISCGVFVCYYVKCIVTDKQCTDVVNISHYRQEIYNTLTA